MGIRRDSHRSSLYFFAIRHSWYISKLPVIVITVIFPRNHQIRIFSAIALTVAQVVKLSSIIAICSREQIFCGISTWTDARAFINRSFHFSSFWGRKFLFFIFSTRISNVYQPKRSLKISRNCTRRGIVGGVNIRASTHFFIKNCWILRIDPSTAEMRSLSSCNDFPWYISVPVLSFHRCQSLLSSEKYT